VPIEGIGIHVALHQWSVHGV